MEVCTIAGLVSLNFFSAEDRHYHVYKINCSQVAEQMHYHDYFQVCFVFRGEVVHRQENNNVVLRRGDAFVIPPCFEHSIHFANEDSVIYSLSFSEALFHSGFSHSRVYRFLLALREAVSDQSNNMIRMRVRLNDSQQQNVNALLDCLIREQNAKVPQELSSAPSLIAATLYTLSQSYYCRPENTSQHRVLQIYGNKLAKCTEYVDQHYADTINLNVLAKQFAMSRSKFCELFPQFTGYSLKQYIRNKRITQAESLIKSRNELSLFEISQLVGYTNTSTFYRNFIQVVGVSPMKYKEHTTASDN